MRCITCGYRLRGLEGKTCPECPECGRPFDPNNPKTHLPEELQPFPLEMLLWVMLFLVGPVAVMVFAAVQLPGERALLAILILPVLSPLPLILIWRHKRRKFKD